jgi:flavodoxin
MLSRDYLGILVPLDFRENTRLTFRLGHCHGSNTISEREKNNMQTSRPLIICESTHHGNTRKVALAIAGVINAQVVEADSVRLEELDTHDLVGFGSGIYFGSHSPRLLRLAERLSQNPRKAFIFSTAGLPILWRRFHKRLRRTLESRGCEVVGEFNCPGWDTYGFLSLIGGIYRKHPNEKDLQRAEVFAASLVPLKPIHDLVVSDNSKPSI